MDFVEITNHSIEQFRLEENFVQLWLIIWKHCISRAACRSLYVVCIEGYLGILLNNG